MIDRAQACASPPAGVVFRSARVGLRLTRRQRRRCFGLLSSAADVWGCLIDMTRWRRQRGHSPLVNFYKLCHEFSLAGAGTFGELSTNGARSVLRRFSDAWFRAAKRRKGGDRTARFPRRKRGLMPVLFCQNSYLFKADRLRLPVARGNPELWVRLDRPSPYPIDQIRSVTLLNEGPRLYVRITAAVPVATYPEGAAPDPSRVAGVDPGIIHPYAVAGPDGEGLLVSGRAVRAENHLHLKSTQARQRAVARRAPRRGQRGSRRWRRYRARQRSEESKHRRRVAQAHHEAAREVVDWCVANRVGTLKIGDPRSVLALGTGRHHNLRLRTWRVAQLLRALTEKAEQAGIVVQLVDERGTSTTCPACARRIPRRQGRTFTCPHCGFTGHRDLVGGTNIAARSPGRGTSPGPRIPFPTTITHRRAGAHLPGVSSARRDPRRRPHHGDVPRGPLAGHGPPRPQGEEVAHPPPSRRSEDLRPPPATVGRSRDMAHRALVSNDGGSGHPAGSLR